MFVSLKRFPQKVSKNAEDFTQPRVSVVEACLPSAGRPIGSGIARLRTFSSVSQASSLTERTSLAYFWFRSISAQPAFDIARNCIEIGGSQVQRYIMFK